VDESTDTYDTIDWLPKNVLATMAKRACTEFLIRFYVAAGSGRIGAESVFPQALVTDLLWAMTYHNGAFMLSNFGFPATFKRRGPRISP
jgi:hypothetical protein